MYPAKARGAKGKTRVQGRKGTGNTPWQYVRSDYWICCKHYFNDSSKKAEADFCTSFCLFQPSTYMCEMQSATCDTLKRVVFRRNV